MTDREQMVARQRALAEFGELALRSDSLDKVLQEACRIVSDALATDLAKVLEIQPETQELLVKVGVGWRPGIVGQTRILMGEWSSEAYAIETAEPVIMQDIRHEERFDIPDPQRAALHRRHRRPAEAAPLHHAGGRKPRSPEPTRGGRGAA